MKASKLSIALAATMLGVNVMSCNSLKKLTREEKGAAVGVGAGAAVGGAIGAATKARNPAVYAIIGSAIGGIAGATIGKYMDKQAKDLKEDLGSVADVERIEEGIKVTMKSGLLFGFDSYQVSANTQDELRQVAETLNKYPDTEILVAGHTDSVGKPEYNQGLSERRANAVADILAANGVKRSRMVIQGYGQTAPAVSNDTPEGREKNRRVELAIVASEKLKRDAKSGSLGQ